MFKIILIRAGAKLRKVTVSFVMSFCSSDGLSVCPSLCLHGVTRLPLDGFSRKFIFECFSNFELHLNLTRAPGTLHEDQSTPAHFFLEREMFCTELYRKSKNILLTFICLSRTYFRMTLGSRSSLLDSHTVP
jgi:hypothetical protein